MNHFIEEQTRRPLDGIMKNCIEMMISGRSKIQLTAEIPTWKRGLDILCILLALPALVPLMLLIAATIKIVSRGPVFFKQERIGFLGKRFTCLKFRSMKCGANTAVHRHHLKQLMTADVPMTKMDVNGDQRLIPLGSLLRATGLDELPQLINVLRGEMSMVGPRPCTPYEYEDYLPWHKQRLLTLPGLTGLWQVSGKNKTTFTEMMNLDIHYARNKSFSMDLKIMSKTFSVLAAQAKEVRSAQPSNVTADLTAPCNRSVNN